MTCKDLDLKLSATVAQMAENLQGFLFPSETLLCHGADT